MPATPSARLHEEHQVMSALLDILKQEQQHLVAAEIEGLPDLTAEKSALVAQMATLAQARHSALGAAGFLAQETGMAAWVAAQQDQPTSALWQQLLDATHEAKELNRINGMLINKHMSHTQGALQALRPQATAAGNLYGPSGGHATTFSKSRGFLAG
ncbi:MAG: flagella synthesis protein FlgN [Sphingomonadaceae bacterium]